MSKLPRPDNPGTSYYYRGECRDYGALTPRVMRTVSMSENEDVMLEDLMRERSDDFGDASTAFTQWMTAQHHGLPTRFLDVSRNPLVALFFACWEGAGGQEDQTEHDGRVIIFSMPSGPDGLIVTYNQYHAALVANFAKLPVAEKSELNNYAEEFRAMRLDSHYQELPALLHLAELISRDQPTGSLIYQVKDWLTVNVGFLSRVLSSSRLRF